MTSRATMTRPKHFAPSKERWQPRPIQKRGVRWLLERHPGAGLLFDPGLGKTSCTLGAIKVLKEQGLKPKVLVVAPIRVMGATWPDELAKWADFEGITYTILHGPKKDARLKEDVDLYLINPEGLEWLLQPVKVRGVSGRKKIGVDIPRFRKLGFNVLVVDELTKFKNHASDRFKMIKHVLPTFKRRWGLTGTPAARYLEPLFGQIYVLDLGSALGAYVSHYRAQFFDKGFDGFTYTAKPGAEEAIYARLAHLALRADARDYLDLPDLVENVLPYELPTKARQLYDELEKDLIAAIDQRLVTAKNAAVSVNKLRQVCSGALYLEPGLGERLQVKRGPKDWLEIHEAKLDALGDLIEELQGQPMIVAYEFQHDLERLRARFGRDLPHIGKGVSLAAGKRVQDDWNQLKIPVLLAHSESISHGLNMQTGGQHVGWFTLTWDYERYDQLVRRLLRQGSTHKRIFSHLFLGRNTVEEQVFASLRAKKDCQNRLFAALKILQKRHR